MIQKLKFISLWLGVIAVKIPTALAGSIMIPAIWKYRNVDYDDLPSWTRPWANPEDWEGGHRSYRNSLPKWWVERKGSDFGAFFKYHAIRNPANGLRSYEWLDLDIDPSKVEYETPAYRLRYEPAGMRADGIKTAYYWAWQGNQAGFKYVRIWNEERHFVCKLGWRIEPKDATVEIDPDGLRHEDAGFATKLLPYRRG